MTTLNAYLQSVGNRLLDQRDARYRAIATPDAVRALQQEIRRIARDTFGAYTIGLDTSPKPPQVLKAGEIKLDGVVIEKFLYEALPDFWVSAVLYRPARPPAAGTRRPAMVMPVGHWWSGKSNPMLQHLMRLLARRGVICASFDDCGQGERVEQFHPVIRDNMQYLMDIHPPGAPVPFPLSDPPRHGFTLGQSVTCHHFLIGDPGYLCGVHQNTLTTLAGKRMVDLLIARKDVDPARIGAMGASGGGTNTRFLAAYDPRIALAVPTSILGSDRSLSGGDADQCFFFTVNRGISQVDLLITHAPKPLLILSASEDRHRSDLVAEYYRPFWKTLGAAANVEYGTGEGPHGFPLGNRKIAAEFVLKHFLNDTKPVLDAEHSDDEPLLSERELNTSFIGNVGCDGVGKRAMDLIRERSLALAKTRGPKTGAALHQAVLKTLLEPDDSWTRPPVNLVRQDRAIQWETEGGVPLQLQFENGLPDAKQPPARVLVYAHDKGPNTPGWPLAAAALALTRLPVGVVQVRGVGISLPPGPESNNALLTPMLASKQGALARMAFTQGRSLLGMRVADLLQTARVLRDTLPAGCRLDLLAEGGLGFAALLAAYLAPEAFARVYLFRAPISWTELAVNEARAYPFSDFLFGVLDQFDLPDIVRELPAGKAVWINPTDAGAKVMSPAAGKRAHRGAAVEFRQARVPAELARLLKK